MLGIFMVISICSNNPILLNEQNNAVVRLNLQMMDAILFPYKFSVVHQTSAQYKIIILYEHSTVDQSFGEYNISCVFEE